MKKRKLLIIFFAALCICAGCSSSSFEADADTIFIEKKGKVVETRVKDFGKSNYSEEELKSFIEQEVENYNNDRGGKPVKVSKFDVKDQKAVVIMEYASVSDFQALIQTELFSGTIAEAQSAGYDFDRSFLRVDGKEKTESANQSSVLERSDDKVVVLTENVNLKVDGTIVYVSAENVQVTGKNTVTIQGLSEDDRGQKSGQAFVIYR